MVDWECVAVEGFRESPVKWFGFSVNSFMASCMGDRRWSSMIL